MDGWMDGWIRKELWRDRSGWLHWLGRREGWCGVREVLVSTVFPARMSVCPWYMCLHHACLCVLITYVLSTCVFVCPRLLSSQVLEAHASWLTMMLLHVGDPSGSLPAEPAHCQHQA